MRHLLTLLPTTQCEGNL